MDLGCRGASLALLTDLYQFTMAYGYWRSGRHREPAEFELFFRDPPFRGSFTLFCGLQEALLYLQDFRLTQEEIVYLESVLPSTVDKAFLEFLETVDASEVTVSSIPEGSVVFAREPLMQVRGPLLVVQLLETTLLSLINYASLVATNAARMRLLVGPDIKLLEMGLRRAQGPNGGLSASKYSYIGGFDSTSNVLAGKLFDIPVTGTLAHSYVSSFSSLEEVQPRMLKPVSGAGPAVDFVSLVETWVLQVSKLLDNGCECMHRGELAAFASYAIAFPLNFLVLVDTYDVFRSGLPNFCAVALALHQLGYQALGLRLDSGDLASLSIEVRSILKTCSEHFDIPWFENVMIAVSNNVSESTLRELHHSEHAVDLIGVGTNLVTCPLQPSLGCVYKLVQVNDSPKMKLTEEDEKMTLPGSKRVYRLYDANGTPFMDLMALADEPPPTIGQEIEVHVLENRSPTKKVTPQSAEILHHMYFRGGQICQLLPSMSEIKAHAQNSLISLPVQQRRLKCPCQYEVALTEKLDLLLNSLRTYNSI